MIKHTVDKRRITYNQNLNDTYKYQVNLKLPTVHVQTDGYNFGKDSVDILEQETNAENDSYYKRRYG